MQALQHFDSIFAWTHSARLFRMHCAELNNGGVMSDNQQGSSMAGYKSCLHPDRTEIANATIDHFVSLAVP